MRSIVILGLRSGTSLASNILHSMGVCMGREFQGPTPKNMTGYYENLEFLHYITGLHDILGRDRYEDPIQEKDFDRIPLAQLRELRDLIQKWQQEPVWGVKVPALLRIIPVMELFLENPKYIVCTRDVGVTAGSLRKYGHVLPRNFDYFGYVTEYFKQALGYMITREYIVLNYEDAITDPRNYVNKLAAFAGKFLEPEKFAELIAKVDPRLNHVSTNNA